MIRKEKFMSRKKLFITGLLCGMLLTGMTRTEMVYAASPSLSASADTGSVTEGDYVNVNVELGNNPAISTLGATLNYDSSVLKYDSSTWNSSFSGSDMQMASDTGSEVNLSVVCDDSYTSDGTVVTVRFQAVKDTSSIPVTLSLRDMADADLEQISDCTVASAVRAPEAQKTSPDPEDNDTIDLENPDEVSDISIVDEKSEPAQHSETTVSDITDGTKSGSNASSDMSQGVSISNTNGGTQTAATSQARSSRPDANYQTGNGLGSDMLLVGAAAFGMLALILAVRHRREDKS